ncbi:MAG: hypothetical protein Tsb0021_08550 [Chlamydiales bacterium]
MAQTTQKRAAIDMESLVEIVNDQTLSVKEMVNKMKAEKGDISIASMFELQMFMNKLSQLSEMASAVVSAMNQSIQSIASKISR